MIARKVVLDTYRKLKSGQAKAKICPYVHTINPYKYTLLFQAIITSHVRGPFCTLSYTYAHTQRKVIVHVSKHSKADAEQVLRLKSAVRQYMKERGALASQSVLKVVGHEYDKHVLPRELKARGELLPLLVDVIQDVMR
jgi:hypothetical protein